MTLISSSASASNAATVKNKGLIAEAYEWDEKEVSSDDNEMVEVKVLMALAEENDDVSKEGAKNGEWVKISMRKVHTLLEMEDNDDRKTYLDYLCIELNYVEEQRNNLLSKHRDLHVNTEILKENKNSRIELKELTIITETWLNSSNKVNQCICKQISSQKKRILGADQLTEDPSSSWQKDLVFVKSSVDDTKVSIPVAVTDSLATDYDSVDESLVCSTPLPPLKKLDGAEPIFGPGSSHGFRIIYLEREINPRNPQHAFKICEACGSSTYTTTEHYDIEWFKRGEALQDKKVEALKLTRAKSSNANRSETSTKSQDLRWCLEMTLHVQLKVMALSNVMFDEKRGIIFNSNKEVVMIAPRVKDVYVLDMTFSAQES
ncbi:hypothetical protein Tco_0759064 [Tanacetum coccineum]